MPFETSPVTISALIAFLDGLLDPGAFEDYGPNGLQVPGGETVTKVVTGVSAQRELIERAVALKAELVLVHHGLFWDFLPTGLTPTLAERVRPLFKHDVALAAYHLPLDAHPEVGNNALLAGLLGCTRHEAFAKIGRLGGQAAAAGRRARPRRLPDRRARRARDGRRARGRHPFHRRRPLRDRDVRRARAG